MSSPEKLRIALIGLGGIAQKAYLPLLTAHAEVDPILCTRDEETLVRLARQYRVVETYTRLEEVIRSKPDAAMVHSATESHGPLTEALIRAGIPVFVDKPLTYTLSESEALIDLALRRRQILYLGFNRRFAPLIRPLATTADPVQISWQKNRIAQPADPRVFIFDDFIHVLDSLRFLAPGAMADLRVHSRVRDGKLEQIQVQWRRGDTQLIGGMNRISGVEEERLEYYSPGNKWVINNLHGGTHFTPEQILPLGFGNWVSTLQKRGFVDMITDWLRVIRAKKMDPVALEDIRATHMLCESLVERVSQDKQS